MVKRSNKPTKEFQKFLLAFEVVEALPTEYDKVKEDLHLSIADYIYNPVKFYETWIEEADKNATLKGHSVMFREKVLPALAQNKSFRSNVTNVVEEEAKKKFMEKWKETQVDTAADDTRRGKILEIVKPILTTEPAKPVVDVPEVKNLVGDSKICWG